MRAILLSLTLLTLSLSLRATNYYFSSSDGDDSRTASQAKNPATPWRSLKKLNAVFASLLPGDSLLLRRGDVFYGSVIIGQSGSSSKPLVISAYGSGAKPVISGFVQLGGWVSKGSGIYESSTILPNKVLNLVVRNQEVQEMGRYPNSDAPNKGFLYYEAHNSASSITDDELPSSPNWKGAELVARVWRQILSRSTITYHSGHTLFAELDATPSDNGFGYFIQDDIRTLDKAGEWYYNKSTRKVSMYFGSMSPSQSTVKVAAIDTLLFASGRNYVTVNGLSFAGSNKASMLLRYCTNVTVSSCDFLYNGEDGLSLNGPSELKILDNTFDQTLSNGIETTNAGSNWTIRGNTITHTAPFPGHMRLGGYGIYVRGNNQTLENNYIDQVGYTGIRFTGSNILIKNNYIANFTQLCDDAGGIYVWAGPNGTTATNRRLVGNIIVNGPGEPVGVKNGNAGGSTSGIYLDDRVSGVEIAGNSIYNCARSGILLLNSYSVQVRDNTLFDNPMQMMLVWRGTAPMKNVLMKRNIFFSARPGQDVVNLLTSATDINQLGSLDSNYYCRPSDENMIIKTSSLNALGQRVYGVYDLNAWKGDYVHDTHTQRTARQMPGYVINSLVGSNKTPNGKFDKDVSGIYSTGTVSWLSSKLDGGTCQIALAGTYHQITLPVGAVSSSKKYILRFSVQSSKDTVLTMYLRQRSGDRDKLSTVRNLTVETSRKEYEFLFDEPVSDPDAAVLFVTSTTNTKVWLDNIQFYEANVSLQDPTKLTRFEYNASSTPRTALLDYPYVDVKGKTYTGSVTLQPYTSVVLLQTNPSYIGSNKLPAVKITSPAGGSSFGAPASLSITASASDPDGTIAKVQFFRDSTLIGTATSAPYTVNWNNVAAGTYTLTARATDNDGVTSTSAAIKVYVKDSNAPTVSITSPVANSSFITPTSITVTAKATDAEGSISKVDFYAGSTLIGTATTAPYSIAWKNAAMGTYNLTAKATDNSGITTTSSAVSINVAATSSNVDGTVDKEIISYGSGWKYLDNGSNQGTAWRTSSYSDGSWKSGEAELGYGDGDESTVVDYGPDENDKYITTYFRKTVTIADTSAFSGYTLNLRRDDGAVVYINGKEVFRSNMPTGTIDYQTLASASSDGGTVVQTKSLSISQLRQGANVIAVEIHQNKASSSDISFDLELLGVPKNATATTSITTSARTMAPVAEETVTTTNFSVQPYPNPSTSYFSLYLQSKQTEPINVYVYDMSGRLLESKTGLAANTVTQFGNRLLPGAYVVQIVQGTQITKTQVVKL